MPTKPSQRCSLARTYSLVCLFSSKMTPTDPETYFWFLSCRGLRSGGGGGVVAFIVSSACPHGFRSLHASRRRHQGEEGLARTCNAFIKSALHHYFARPLSRFCGCGSHQFLGGVAKGVEKAAKLKGKRHEHQHITKVEKSTTKSRKRTARRPTSFCLSATAALSVE